MKAMNQIMPVGFRVKEGNEWRNYWQRDIGGIDDPPALYPAGDRDYLLYLCYPAGVLAAGRHGDLYHADLV